MNADDTRRVEKGIADRKTRDLKWRNETYMEKVARFARGAPDPSVFTNENGVYVPSRFAEWVLADPKQMYSYDVECGKLFYYDRGGYRPHGDIMIMCILVAVMDGLGINTSNARATARLVERSCEEMWV